MDPMQMHLIIRDASIKISSRAPKLDAGSELVNACGFQYPAIPEL